MYKLSYSLTAIVCVAVVLQATPAHALTFNESLTRMDVLIAEMQKLRAEFALLAKGVSASSGVPGAVLGASTASVLTDDLAFGVTNESITRIQKLLATDSEIYADGTVSGFFGPKTQDAIRRFQTRFGLDPVGVVGPSTKAILEAFMAKYPNDTYPADVLKGGVPKVAGATTSVPPAVSTPVVTPVTPTASRIASITFDVDDGEVVVHSRNLDGTRNRDYIFYPDDEDELVEEIAKALKISETSVRAVADLDEVRLGRSSNSDDEEEEADEALNDAEDAIDEAEEAIDEADADGENTNDAEDILDEAYDMLDEAEEAYDEEDFEDAIDLAKEAADLAEEAIDEL